MIDQKDIKLLNDYNKWRRGDENLIMPTPRELGECIDRVIEVLDNLASSSSIVKTKQEIKEGLWHDSEKESDGWKFMMEYGEFMITLDKYEKALKNMESSSVIHIQPKHGFYYWVKHYDDSEYEVAHAVEYCKEIHFEFMMDTDNFPFPKDVSDWKRTPIQSFNSDGYL